MPVFKNATAEQVAFALVTAEHDAAGTRKDGVSELEEAKLYASQLLLVGFKEGTTLAMARKQFVTADDAGADGAGADGAGADGAGPDGDEGAAEDDHDATEDSGNVRRAQSVSKRTVVAPASEEEAELDDAPARPQKRAKTNVYAVAGFLLAGGGQGVHLQDHIVHRGGQQGGGGFLVGGVVVVIVGL
jgi:hypothetical protein